eukprot:544501-Prorocentrum_minimum.AAC.1
MGRDFLCACRTLVSCSIITCAPVSSNTWSRSVCPAIVLFAVLRLQQFQVAMVIGCPSSRSASCRAHRLALSIVSSPVHVFRPFSASRFRLSSSLASSLRSRRSSERSHLSLSGTPIGGGLCSNTGYGWCSPVWAGASMGAAKYVASLYVSLAALASLPAMLFPLGFFAMWLVVFPL